MESVAFIYLMVFDYLHEHSYKKAKALPLQATETLGEEEVNLLLIHDFDT
jgi:hypothetical protein